MCQFDTTDHDSNISDKLPLHIVCKSAIFRLLISLSTRTMLILNSALNDFVGITETCCRTIMLLENYCSRCYDINTTDLSLFDSPEGVHEFAGSIYDRTVTGNALQELQIFIFLIIRKAITSFGGIKSFIY